MMAVILCLAVIIIPYLPQNIELTKNVKPLSLLSVCWLMLADHILLFLGLLSTCATVILHFRIHHCPIATT